MDTIKLKSAEELLHTVGFQERLTEHKLDIALNSIINNKEHLIKVIKEAQRNAIEYTLKVASENAVADVYFHGWLAEESMKSGEPFVEGEDYEAYVINSSITGLKDKIFEENNL